MERGTGTVIARVRDFIRTRELVRAGQTVVVAVSGGPDSVCLLHVLLQLQDELEIKLLVAHLDHGLRGEASRRDAEYVTGLARQLGLPAIVETRDIRSFQAKHRLSPEEAAREVRYAFLAETVKKAGAAAVAAGHTLNDQVETVLMHLVRGAGLRGLRGLQPASTVKFAGTDVTIVRPLLEVTRADTLAYTESRRLNPRIDDTNTSLSYFRNRIRWQLMPLLRDFNARIEEAVVRTADLAADDYAYLETQVSAVWDDIVTVSPGARLLDKEQLLRLPVSLKRHLLRRAVEQISGDLKDIEAAHIERLIAGLAKPSGRKVELPGGISLVNHHDVYLLAREAAAAAPFAGPVDRDCLLKIPGETRIPGWLITAEIKAGKGTGYPDNEFAARLDFGVAGDKLTVGPRRRGDRFQPLGLKSDKKLSDFMIDARIPRAWRPRVPVVRNATGVVWVVGYRIDENARVTGATRQTLNLTFHRSD